MFTLILAYVTAFCLTYFIVPTIIRVAKARRFYDNPNERSSHVEPTPSLGGIGIFAGAICGIVLWVPVDQFGLLQYMLAAFVLIFLIGTLDDITPVTPVQKLFGQLLVSIILVYKSKIGLHSFYGLFGVEELGAPIAFTLSVVAITGIINAFNLIDGINGLAGSIGLLVSVFFGVWFFFTGDVALSVVAVSLAGGIVAFLRYNFSGRIFMGDTGSLLIGTVAAILAFRFIETNYAQTTDTWFVFDSAPAVAFSVLLLPIFDTLRVFAARIVKGRSPFRPDKNHIHHLLLRTGLNHTHATLVLIGVNVAFIALTVALDHLGSGILLGIQWAGMACITWLFARWSRTKEPL